MTGDIPAVDLQPEFTTYNCKQQPFFAVPPTTSFCTIRAMRQTHIGARIRESRDKVGQSQSDLARALGIKPQAVQKWEAGLSAPRNERLLDIAQTLNTSVRELVRGTDLEGIADSDPLKDASGSKVFPRRDAKHGVPHTKTAALPLISWERACDWGSTVGTVEVEEVQDWIQCPFEHGPNAFILEVAGESNYDPNGPKSYAQGDFIAVDPSRAPANRSMVVVRIDHEERATLKQLLMDEGSTKLLKSLNPNWPNRVSPMPEGAKIIGVVIGKWVPE